MSRVSLAEFRSQTPPNVQNGLPTNITQGTLATALTFNGHAELNRANTTASGAALFDLQLTRDDLGRITSKKEITPAGTNHWSYVYDETGRLATVQLNGSPHATYSYDQNGNRLTRTDADGNTEQGETDNQDRLTRYGQESFEYNDAGEMTSRTGPSGETTTYTYNATGNLKTAKLADDREIEYLHDAAGRRIARKVDGQTTNRYLYGPEAITPVAEVDGSGNTTARFVYGTSSSTPDYILKGANTYRILTDQLGSVRLVVNSATGNIAQEITYDEFGRVLDDTNPGFQPFGFAGGLNDADTGLVHFGAREYDPVLGRFTSKDPIGFAGGDTNLYGYVLGDPVNFFDPSGLFLDTFVDVGFIAYDIYTIGKNAINGCLSDSDLGALGLDIGGALIPGVTGLGMVGKAGGRGAKRSPDPTALGPHSVFQPGRGYTTFVPNGPPGRQAYWEKTIRYDGVGGAHGGIPTPHVHDGGKVRPPRPDEIPRN